MDGPRKERAPIARSFVAKAVHNMLTTTALLDRLASNLAVTTKVVNHLIFKIIYKPSYFKVHAALIW